MEVKSTNSIKNEYCHTPDVRHQKFYNLYQNNRTDDDNKSEGDESGRWENTGLKSIYGTAGFAMKTLNISYKELMWGIPWGTILRMLSDLPSQKYVDNKLEGKPKEEVKELTPQNASDFAKHIQELNKRNIK